MRRGIGGRTVAEARRRLSYAELLEWAAWLQVVMDDETRARKKNKGTGLIPW